MDCPTTRPPALCVARIPTKKWGRHCNTNEPWGESDRGPAADALAPMSHKLAMNRQSALAALAGLGAAGGRPAHRHLDRAMCRPDFHAGPCRCAAIPGGLCDQAPRSAPFRHNRARPCAFSQSFLPIARTPAKEAVRGRRRPARQARLRQEARLQVTIVAAMASWSERYAPRAETAGRQVAPEAVRPRTKSQSSFLSG